MNRIPVLVCLIPFFLLLHTTKSREIDVKIALLNFILKLNTNSNLPDPKWGWNASSDPCKNHWKGVVCDNKTLKVKSLVLDALNFTGTFDPSIICSKPGLDESLNVISLNNNMLNAENIDAISSCTFLTKLHLRGNNFSGSLPDSLSRLSNLKVLDVSNNQFSGILPNLSRILGLEKFLAQNNHLSGPLPNFDFSNFRSFNVSKNNLTGPIPDGGSRLPNSSFVNNQNLCGEPLPNKCPPAKVVPFSPPPQKPQEQKKLNPQEQKKSNNGYTTDQVLMFSGYFAIGLVVVLLVTLKFCRKGKKKQETVIDTRDKLTVVTESKTRGPSTLLDEYKSVARKSVASVESGGAAVSPSMVVLTSTVATNGLRFEDLLKGPAQLLGRGKHGSVYKVKCEDQGIYLAVKRMSDLTISSDVFQQRMKRLDQVRHPNVLPPIAFYCSKQEKLVVYEYQPNGSLFNLLHGNQMNQVFDWSSRLSLSATIAKALAFMHQELSIPHVNLKSTNILLNQNMEPCISEYGLMLQNQEHPFITEERDVQASFGSDIYAFGVILLEMLTGKVAGVKNNGMDLAKWVVSVVKEEWTIGVFDRSLIREGASEGRMLNLLEIAIKCIDHRLEARPSMNQVGAMIDSIKEEDERSLEISKALNF